MINRKYSINKWSSATTLKNEVNPKNLTSRNTKIIKMKNFKFIAFIFIYYPKRVRLFYKLYFKNWGETFYLPRFYKEHPNESKK